LTALVQHHPSRVSLLHGTPEANTTQVLSPGHRGKDIALNSNGGPAANIVSVGGFLGMGEHYVAVNPAALNVT
jgi:hypothetical protein